jgi:effector-binding domain-containing protein
MILDPLIPLAATIAVCTLLCMRSPGQTDPQTDPLRPADSSGQPDAQAEALLARFDQRRLGEAAGKHALRIEGTYAVTFAGQPGNVVAKGPFRELYLGHDLARHVTEMGEMGKLERGTFHELTWEVDPAMGAKVRRGSQAAAMRRYFAWLRGAPVRGLYARAAVQGQAKVGEHDCTVLTLTPKEGQSDLAYVDRNATLHRLDIALPSPESADAAFGVDDAMPAQVTFAQWREVAGIAYAERRTLRMGPAIVESTCTSIRTGKDAPELADAQFAPPKAVVEKQREPAPTPAFDADGKPLYQVVQRQAQPAATIRTKCKFDEVSKTLASVLPEVMQHITASGGKLMGPPFTIYHSFGPDEIDLEAGMPVQNVIAAAGRVKNSELPAGRTVTVWHVGPYDKLGAAHDALQAHLAAQKLQARGGPYEIYWTDPGMVPDPAKWKTQLFAPIE